MTKQILCKKCKTQIGIEESGKAKYYDRCGSYFFCNTIMGKNYGGELCDNKYCKKCYDKIIIDMAIQAKKENNNEMY